MKRTMLSWVSVWSIAAFALASFAHAQTGQTPAGSGSNPSGDKKSSPSVPGTMPAMPTGPTSAPAGTTLPPLQIAQRGAVAGNITAAATGATAAAGAAAGGTTTIANPLILPGLLTASQTESILPVDRIFFQYSHYDSFQVIRSVTIAPVVTTTRETGFDLHRYDFGFEKTLWDERASVFLRVPILDAVNNTTGQNIESFGNLNAGVKFILFENEHASRLLTAGLTVSAPTGRDAVFPTATTAQTDIRNGIEFITGQSVNATTTINPTFLQPWIGAHLGDRFFVQEYFGVIIPTDDRVATFINNSVTAGVELCPGDGRGWITSLTPMVSVQTLIPTEQRGSGAQPFGFSDQVFLSSGGSIGIGERTTLSAAVITPLSGPRAFDIGFTVGISFIR